ncbi:50S ribosomal protein L22 [Candidatus Dojkabacteria bacterium]|nr:50S ribosomal protein L22 [Candidatus Dojkabacteria bacterium]
MPDNKAKSKQVNNKETKKVQKGPSKKKVAKRINTPDKKRVSKTKESGGDESKVVYAVEKYLNISARKARLVVDLVRGGNALDAVKSLEFLNKKAALFVKKAVESAVSNAVNNFEMNKDKLFIVEAFIDEAPTFKRGRAGSRGRYKKILKRNCHIKIGVAEK